MSLKVEILTQLTVEYVDALYTGLSMDSEVTNADGDTEYTKEAQRHFNTRYDRLEKQFDKLCNEYFILADLGSE
jgi:hypothetical protein